MSDRPNPLTKVALSIGLVVPTVVALAGAAVTFGWLSSAKATAITSVAQVLPDALINLGAVGVLLVGILSGAVGAFTTAKVGAAKVTPIESPAIEDPSRPGELAPLVIDPTYTAGPLDHIQPGYGP